MDCTPPPKVVELHKAKQRWIPAKERAKGCEVTEEEKATIEIYGKFQGILNKLTPQKFQALAEQALQLEINTEDRLKGIIDKIFTRALVEPKFCIAYVNLCKVMSPIKVEWPHDGKTKVTTFRRMLLTKCQQEFEKKEKDDEEKERMLATIEQAETDDKKKQLSADLEVEETKARKRWLGNIRFIGELFKLKMLSATIMHECIVRLLKSSSDEESLECFARLITTIGKYLDLPEAKVRIDGYFGRMQDIIRKGKISAQIKFMLQDVMELRVNLWVPRGRQDQSLKTIDQIHAEAHAEEERTKHMVAQHQMTGQFKPPMRGDDRRGRRDSRDKGGGEDWQKVRDDRKRKDDKPTKVDMKRITSLLTSRRGDKTKETSMTQPPPPTTVVTAPAMDEDTISRKTSTIIDELSENNDFKEAIECVKDMKVPSQLHVFVRELMNHTMEKTEHSRVTASKLLKELLREKVLSEDRFKAGLSEVLEFAEDMEIDIPKIWDYMAQLLSHPISEPTLVPLSLVISTMPASLVESGKVAVFVAKVMNQLKGVYDTESAVVSLWKGCGLKWEELGVKSEDLEQLIAREKLGFLVPSRPGSAVLSSPSPSHLPELMTQFKASDTTNDDIMNWIEKHCSSERRTPSFIRTLSTALLQAFVTGSGNTTSFESMEFKRRSAVVLKKYVDSKRNLQLEILYAFQITVAKLNHPPQLLHNLFHILYDLEVVDEAAFLEWRDRGKERFGKGNAVHSLTDFFAWLDHANPESDPDS